MGEGWSTTDFGMHLKVPMSKRASPQEVHARQTQLWSQEHDLALSTLNADHEARLRQHQEALDRHAADVEGTLRSHAASTETRLEQAGERRAQELSAAIAAQEKRHDEQVDAIKAEQAKQVAQSNLLRSTHLRAKLYRPAVLSELLSRI